MLDLVSVLTKGGIVLWSKAFTNIRLSTTSASASSASLTSSSVSAATASSHPIDALIREVLVEERAGLTHYDKDSYRVQWAFANDLDLIFVVSVF
jgi:signal recognition particle receptor subunit alpha